MSTPTMARMPFARYAHLLVRDTTRLMCGGESTGMTRYNPRDLPSGDAGRTRATCPQCRMAAR